MKRMASLVAVLLGLQSTLSTTNGVAPVVGLGHNSGPPAPTRADMEADLEHLTVRLKRAWAYAEDKHAWLGVDLDALHAAAGRELDHVHNADDFYFVVKKYVGGLMDGHASVRPGHDSPALSRPMRWPFEVTRLDGHFYVERLSSRRLCCGRDLKC